LLDSSLLEDPAIGFTLEGLIAKIEEKVTARRASVNDDMPVVRTLLQLEIAEDLVELTPRWRVITEAALPPIPTLVIRRPEAILLRTSEPDTKALIFCEASKTEGVGPERQHNVATIDLHGRIRSVRLSIPAVVQLSELRRHASLSNAK